METNNKISLFRNLQYHVFSKINSTFALTILFIFIWNYYGLGYTVEEIKLVRADPNRWKLNCGEQITLTYDIHFKKRDANEEAKKEYIYLKEKDTEILLVSNVFDIEKNSPVDGHVQVELILKCSDENNE